MGVRMQPNTYSPAMLELHIEELVLHGFPVAQRMSIGDAVQQELQRLLTEQGLDGFAVGPVNIERINGGMFRVARGARPETVGSQLARQIHQQFPQRQKASPSGKQPKGAKSAR